MIVRAKTSLCRRVAPGRIKKVYLGLNLNAKVPNTNTVRM
jgi:hypothetical protein